ncbi:MAG: HAMP domain-containing sensor histidine kinase [Planctomycetota bacterium]
MWRGISLANKCLLLFGVLVVSIVGAAMVVPWIRMDHLVEITQREALERELSRWVQADEDGRRALRLGARFLTPEEAAKAGDTPRFNARWDGTTRVYTLTQPVDDGAVALIEHRSTSTPAYLVTNVLILLAAAAVVAALAVTAFYFITNKIILVPVRDLRWTAEQIARGDTDVRADLTTGDEFEELAQAFNEMLEKRLGSEEKLRRSNRALDVKVGELASANLALADAARVKGEFVASVSHELRTPLNSILGFADLLRAIAERESADKPSDAKPLAQRRRYLEHIQQGGRHLLQLVDEMLELARIEAGRIELDNKPLDPAELCEGVLGLFEPIARREGVTLDFENATPNKPSREGAPAATPVGPIVTDRGRVQQIIFNFLSNAVKFAPLGSDEPRVTLRIERLADGGARLSVIDNGPGIEEQHQARIFEKFEQVDSSETRDAEGAGLGLAIAKELARIVQGEIRLESQPGSGSMFCLILPSTPNNERLEEERLETRFRADLARQVTKA